MPDKTNWELIEEVRKFLDSDALWSRTADAHITLDFIQFRLSELERTNQEAHEKCTELDTENGELRDMVRELEQRNREQQAKLSSPAKCTQCPYSVGDIYERDCAFPDCVGGWEQAYLNLCKEFMEQQARIAELERDATRYRKLRDECNWGDDADGRRWRHDWR